MIKGFWVYPKITSANLYKPIHDIINYFTSICSFESGKCAKGKNYKNLNVSRINSFLDKIKIKHMWRMWGTPHNFFLAFIDELEKQIIITKTVEVGQ